MADWAPGPALVAYHAGVTVICELAAQFTAETWAAPTPCPEWRAADLAAHLRCVADDYHEYLDDAPVSRLARLMESSADPDSLARKLARQNAAELAALADGGGADHIAAFAASARAYAQRIVPVWDLPHHSYRDTVVTVGGMLGAACAEWHLHAWDLARALGKDYRPADPDILVAGWQMGMPHLSLDAALAVAACGAGSASAAGAAGRAGARRGAGVPRAQGGGVAARRTRPTTWRSGLRQRGGGGRRGGRFMSWWSGGSEPCGPGARSPQVSGGWRVLLRASGRLP